MAKKLAPVHPGEILHQDFMLLHGLSQNRLAKGLGVPSPRIGEIVNRRRAITPNTALRLGFYFGTTPEFWMNLQTHYDLEVAREQEQAAIERDVQPIHSAAAV